MPVSPLFSALLLFTAVTLTACTDPGPVAPNAARPDAPNSPSLATASGVSDNLTIPVTFTIAGGTCGVASTVSGTGLFHIVARSTQTANGAWHVSFSWSAHGTATGADGSSYRFNYAINAKAVDPTGPDDIVVIDLVDHFNLLGQGKTPDMKIFLKGTFTFPAFEPIGNAVIRGPGIFCDPI
jgi:hypothetical protein